VIQQSNTTRLNDKNLVLSSVAIPDTSLSSSRSTDGSSLSSAIPSSDISTNKKHLFYRMLTLKRAINNSNNLRIFNNQYSIVVHFLDDTERTFFIDVSLRN
jgi:hypothetical protein